MVNYLSPIDLEDDSLSENVIKKTVEMATGVKGARIYVMTVVPGIAPGINPLYAIRGEMHGSEEYPLQEWKDEAAKELKKLADKYVPKEMLAGVVVENGTVYREIVEAAKDLDISHIVMGAHRPSLADYLLGPNSARVARHAGCSVTVVRD
ncbi:MAG TPA: universal stress protein [Gammaproteobacteria bacterium]|nr:universal stress protein [Gammaproteobacteria bacterium]